MKLSNNKKSDLYYLNYSLTEKVEVYYKFFIEDLAMLEEISKDIHPYKEKIKALIFKELDCYEFKSGRYHFKPNHYLKDDQKLSSELGHLTKNWNIDWLWIIYHIKVDFLNIGLAMNLMEIGENYVFKNVLNKNNAKAEKIYLKNRKTREPKIFRIDELLKNGHGLVSNKKKIQPIIGVTLWRGYNSNFWDYTILEPVLKGYSWSKEKRYFVPQKIKNRKVKRKSKIYITIGDKEYTV